MAHPPAAARLTPARNNGSPSSGTLALSKRNIHSVRVAIGSERVLPVLTTVEHTDDVDDYLAGRLIHLMGDERPLLEGGRPHPRPYVVALPTATGEREHENSVDMVEDH